MEDHDIPYFRNLWLQNTTELENQCKKWEELCTESEIPDDVKGEIRTTIGLARLLMNQKLKQFKGLIDDSEFHTGEKEITCSDLQGFWDMVYFEVEKIQRSFDRLSKCKKNEWQFKDETVPKLTEKRTPVKKDFAAINKRKEMSDARILAARQRIAEARKKMMADRKNGKDQNLIEILQPKNNSVLTTSETDQSDIKEEKRKSCRSNDVKITPAKASVPIKELANSELLKKAKNKKNYNKENVSINNESVEAKYIKSGENICKSSEKKKSREYGKLQCVTRSAARRALVLQHCTKNE